MLHHGQMKLPDSLQTRCNIAWFPALNTMLYLQNSREFLAGYQTTPNCARSYLGAVCGRGITIELILNT